MTTPADSNGFVSLAVTGDSSLVISKLSESLLGISASITATPTRSTDGSSTPDVYSYVFTWGDGQSTTVTSGASLNISSTQTHTYAKTGTYTVQVQVNLDPSYTGITYGSLNLTTSHQLVITQASNLSNDSSMEHSRIVTDISVDDPVSAITAETPIASIAYAGIIYDVSLDFRGLNPFLQDTASASDSITTLFEKLIDGADVVSVTDSHVFDVSKVLADSATATDDFLGEANVDDDQTIHFYKNAAETANTTEAANITFEKAVADNTTSVTDSLVSSFAKVAADTASAVDSASLETTSALSDSASTAESLTSSFAKVLADTASSGDSGTLFMTDYCDISYFDSDYVGTSTSF